MNATKANGVKESFMERVSKHYQMVQFSTEIGKKAVQLVRACANTLMELNTPEVGSMVNLME